MTSSEMVSWIHRCEENSLPRLTEMLSWSSLLAILLRSVETSPFRLPISASFDRSFEAAALSRLSASLALVAACEMPEYEGKQFYPLSCVRSHAHTLSMGC